jgi:hypothetical protein
MIDLFALVLLSILTLGVLINNTPILRLGGQFTQILLAVLVWFMIIMIIGGVIFVIFRGIAIAFNKIFKNKFKTKYDF